MKCKYCGAELPDDSKFCTHCGKGVEMRVHRCIKCGAVLEDGAEFCTECGARQHAPKTQTKSQG